MLTTTTDGLWVLQVLSRTEVLAPELGLRPYLPSVETEQLALRHPVAEELRSAGVINDHGGIDDILLEWLTVLSRRDVALLLDVRVPTPQGLPERVMLARFAQWWVTLERRGSMVRLSGVGVATTEESAATLIGAQIQRSCGAMRPAAFRPVTLGTAEVSPQPSFRQRPNRRFGVGRRYREVGTSLDCRAAIRCDRTDSRHRIRRSDAHRHTSGPAGIGAG